MVLTGEWRSVEEGEEETDGDKFDDVVVVKVGVVEFVFVDIADNDITNHK